MNPEKQVCRLKITIVASNRKPLFCDFFFLQLKVYHKELTSIKSSSAPLNRKISGLGGTQPESIVSLAISNIDAANEQKMMKFQTCL